MATHQTPARLALLPFPDVDGLSGAWWPASRSLTVELGTLITTWPLEGGRILRVLYSPPDWDDRPRSVPVGEGHRIKTGCFPRDDTHRLILSMMDGARRALSVIAPDTPPDTAAALLASLSGTPRVTHAGS